MSERLVWLNLIKNIIFDLDDTLCDSTQLINESYTIVRNALTSCLDSRYSQLLDETFKVNSFEFAISELIKQAKEDKKEYLINDILTAKEHFYIKDNNFEINLLPSARETLEKLVGAKKQLFLVTIGDEMMQLRKIKKLGIGHYFKSHYIANPICGGSTKEKLFKDILNYYNLNPYNCDIMVVGDKLKDELKYGHELGFLTVQVLHGKYKDAKADFEPHYKISSLLELLGLLRIK